MFGRKEVAHNSRNDEELMVLLTNGDRMAFEALYDRYFSKLVSFARGFVSNEQQCEDLVQDLFMKLIERPDQFDVSKKFSTWIYVVAANRCKQVLRDQKNRHRIIRENVTPYGERFSEMQSGLDLQTMKRRLALIYADLSEKEKNIYTLRFEQERQIKDIAEILAIPEGSVKSGIYYLLKKFSHHLKEFNHGT